MVEVVGLETRKNRYRVFQVVDMSDVEVSVDVVSEGLVAYARHAIGNGLVRETSGVEGKVDGIEEGQSTTEGVAEYTYPFRI